MHHPWTSTRNSLSLYWKSSSTYSCYSQIYSKILNNPDYSLTSLLISIKLVSWKLLDCCSSVGTPKMFLLSQLGYFELFLAVACTFPIHQLIIIFIFLDQLSFYSIHLMISPSITSTMHNFSQASSDSWKDFIFLILTYLWQFSSTKFDLFLVSVIV